MDKFLKEVNPVLLLTIAAIFLIGLFSLYSVSHQPGGEMVKNFAIQQLVWMGFAVALSIFVVRLGYERFLDYAYFIFALNLLLLLSVLVVGSVRFGAKRWFSLGLFSLQPSEFCKISFILALVRYVSDNSNRLHRFKVVLISLLICAVPMVLIIKQPDLGTAVVFLPILLLVLFAAGARISHLIYLIITGLASAPVLWHILRDYQQKRLLVFLNPNADPLGAGYTVIQSRIAIGSGGLLGKGWLSGTQNQLNFLPERHSDFIFSVIGEEWGLGGAILILGFFFLLIMLLLEVANATHDLRGKLLVVGVVTTLWFQIFINLAMTIGLVPVVGLPLPLVSYGGSSLVTTVTLIALAISVGLKRKIF